MIKEGTERKILPDTSFITTVYNEEEAVVEFLESLMEQTYLPGEIIIVDGGSGDHTFEKVLRFFKIETFQGGSEPEISLESSSKEYRTETRIENSSGIINVKIIKKSRANISQGRNEAIKNASGRIICVSDAGCILDKNWLAEITRFYDDSSCDAVGGLNMPYCRNFTQKCLAVCIMPLKNEIKSEKYMPSSRNISFKKNIWTDTGGYPENMDYGEDMKFNFVLKDRGYKIKFNPAAVVYWKMRENPVRISKQFFRYAKGDAAGRMYPRRHIIRFTAFLIFIIILFSAFYINKWILLALIPLFIIYVYKPYLRFIKTSVGGGSCRFYGKEKFLSILFIPLLLLQIDFSKMCGYTYGLFKNIIK